MSDEHQKQSPMSTPVSVDALLSTSSDAESIISLNESSGGVEALVARVETHIELEPQNDRAIGLKLVHPDFAFSDGNIEVQTTDQLFWVHEFQLNKFSKLAQLIEEVRTTSASPSFGQRLKINCDVSGIDVANTLQVIYASVINGPSQFDKTVLASALRIATAYNYPDLREFAITSLEKANLTPIDRIQLSDEFDLPSWEKPAFMELCRRREAITPLEAKVLGIDRFVEVARIREAEQRHQLVGDFVDSVKSHILTGVKKKTSGKNLSDISVPMSLPPCNCSVSCTHIVSKCAIHDVAPQVLVKCQSLLKERDELQEGLEKATTILTSQESKARSWGLEKSSSADKGNEYISLEDELKKAAWIRPVRTS